MRSMTKRLLGAALMLGFAGAASAQSLTISDEVGQQGQTVSVSVDFTAGGGAAGYSTKFTYDNTQFGVPTVQAGAAATCTITDATGEVTVFRFTLPASVLPDETACVIDFPIDGAAAFQVNPLTSSAPDSRWSDTSAVESALTVNDGSIEVVSAPPTTQTVTASGNAGGTVSPASQDVASGSTAVVTIDPDPGFQIASIGGTCGGSPDVAPPTTSTVTYTTDPVGTAGDSDNSADCTVTAAFESIPAPSYSSTPAPGSTLNCASGGTTSVNIQNTGDLVMNVSCSIAAPFSSAGPSATIAPGDNSDVTITCPTVADGDPPVNGTLVCSSDGGPDASYPVIASAIPPVPPAIPTPELVPASSLWSKLMLFGFLAGLGALVISLRRS